LRPDVPVHETLAVVHGRTPDVSVYVINAQPGKFRPGILHLHGGGFTSGSARASAPDMQEIAAELDCTILSVDFRNAPETRYTGSLEDNYSALLWMHAHADELGVDRERIAVMGESGGGGHAALLTLTARDRAEVAIRFQMLTYPMLDDRTGTSHPVPPHLEVFGWNPDANRFSWRCFLGQEPGTDEVPSHAVPARVDNLSGLPPTFIGVGAFDLFVQEDIAYARRLIEACVPTELLVVPGAFHGFDVVAKEAAVSRRFAAAKLSALRRAFEPRQTLEQ
jgi:acetyl esterase/lipase